MTSSGLCRSKTKSLKLMKWLHIASKCRIDCVMVQQSMTNCQSNPFNWQDHPSLSYNRKLLLSTQAQLIMSFLGVNLCFRQALHYFGLSSKLVPVTKLDLFCHKMELVTWDLKQLTFAASHLIIWLLMTSFVKYSNQIMQSLKKELWRMNTWTEDLCMKSFLSALTSVRGWVLFPSLTPTSFSEGGLWYEWGVFRNP